MASIPPEIPPQGDDFLVLGQNSYLKPQKLQNGQYSEGMNLMCRGGSPHTRPGTRTVFNCPNGNLQGVTLFSPSGGVAHLVFAVDGLVYASPFPFSAFVQVPNLQFSPTSRFVAWAATTKSTTYNSLGELEWLPNPKSILVIQDGSARAGYWDGVDSGHLNPEPSASEITTPGKDGTPLGLWMVWSNNRLWVSRRNRVFASDIGNPLKFTEAQYLNEARSFLLPGDCTGIVETSDQRGILCFTKENITLIQSSLQDRLSWLDTSDMARTVIPNVGCSAPRSLVQQYGLLWWYSSKGLINLNDAARLNVTSRMDIQDNEMFSTKKNVSFDLSGVCGSFYENLLLMSVPCGDRYNPRTMVMDQAPFDGGSNAWTSHWTGWRPIEWARGVVDSEERIFFASVDYDGRNRIWEAMTPDRTDNGVPITCYLMTREHLFESRDFKRFNYAEIEVEGLVGEAAVMVAAAGTRGAYQKVATVDINATKGQVYAGSEYGPGANQMGNYRAQSRLIRTDSEGATPSECNSVCVESDKSGLIDKAFSLLIAWSGNLGISSYRIFVSPEPNVYAGGCENDEEGPRLLNEYGCGSLEMFSHSVPFDEFAASSTFSKIDPVTGITETKTEIATSSVSQADADRKAAIAAQVYVLTKIGEL